MNLYLPGQPRHLKITSTMVDDFLCDPVLGAKVIMRVDLDAFQASRLRTYWWVPDVIDSSGFGTGKSFVFWVFMNLRCIILGDQWCYAYYQTFSAGQQAFWPYFNEVKSRAPLYAAQLGRIDKEGDPTGKDNTRGAACWLQHFRNESLIAMPAPNWMQNAVGQASLTMNVAGLDEWTKSEAMSKGRGKTGRTATATDDNSGGINQQILGRLRRRCFNQYHPLWGNHCVFMATSESPAHPGYARVRSFQEEISKGNPNFALISYSHKDFSNRKSFSGKSYKDEVPNWTRIRAMRAQFSPAHYRREVLGLWARETRGWYSEAALARCRELGLRLNVQPEIKRTAPSPLGAALRAGDGARSEGETHYFLGVDPAPAQSRKADDFGLGMLKVWPKLGLGRPVTAARTDWNVAPVWAYRLRNASPRQASGLIHQKHLQFNLTGIMMDPNGGGQWIMAELNKGRQLIAGIEQECTPIASLDDVSVSHAHLILNLWRRQDPGVQMLWTILQGDDNLNDAMHTAFQEIVEHGELALPKPYNERPREETQAWPEELHWALRDIDAAVTQLMAIHVATTENGSYQLTRHVAKQFTALGKKDLAYALIYAYVRFLIWLKMSELEFAGEESDGGVAVLG